MLEDTLPLPMLESPSDVIPSADRCIMDDQRNKEFDKMPRLTSKELTDAIILRISTEVALGERDGEELLGYGYAGAALQKWIDDETHFALEGKPVDHARYLKVREAIVRGVVMQAARLFSTWDDKHYPRDMEQDSRNLRGPLGQYVPEHLQKQPK